MSGHSPLPVTIITVSDFHSALVSMYQGLVEEETEEFQDELKSQVSFTTKLSKPESPPGSDFLFFF